MKAPGLVGHAHVQGVDVGIGVHGDGLHAVVAAGAHHAHGDLASVRNQDFFHGIQDSMASKGRMGWKRTQAFTGIWPARSRWCGATQAITG